MTTKPIQNLMLLLVAIFLVNALLMSRAKSLGNYEVRTQLSGKWRITDLCKKPGDSTTYPEEEKNLEKIKKEIVDREFYKFSLDGRYQIVSGFKDQRITEKGDWSIDQEGKYLTTQNSRGQIIRRAMQLEGNTIRLLDKDFQMELERIQLPTDKRMKEIIKTLIGSWQRVNFAKNNPSKVLTYEENEGMVEEKYISLNEFDSDFYFFNDTRFMRITEVNKKKIERFGFWKINPEENISITIQGKEYIVYELLLLNKEKMILKYLNDTLVLRKKLSQP